VALKVLSAFVSFRTDATLKLPGVHGEAGVCGRMAALALDCRYDRGLKSAEGVECGGRSRIGLTGSDLANQSREMSICIPGFVVATVGSHCRVQLPTKSVFIYTFNKHGLLAI
jgi:hypothetical protein